MDEKLYQPEPIPHRPQAGSARPSRTPMNGSRPDARQIIARIRADNRFQSTARTTARHPTAPIDAAETPRCLAHSPERDSTVKGTRRKNMAADGTAAGVASGSEESLFSSCCPAAVNLPERYREMRAISRWQEGANGQPGRWLTEAELFWRQGSFMADWEDDCPYNGLFKSYYPTYNAMSDRQLRGYFTWRAAVRAGDIQETSLSFAYVYLYELINGIGVAGPLEGFHAIEDFWQAYRAFAPELDRYASVWLQDYVVYHGLDPQLLAPYKTASFDRALIALRDADAKMTTSAAAAGGRRKRGESVIPLPPDTMHEQQLFDAIDALSTYRLSKSLLFKEQPDALRHVACAVYVRMSEHHRKQRKNSLLESWFGEEVTLPYTMFGSAVFFEPARHADAVYELDEIHRYRCTRGLWTCERFHGSRSRSPKLGAAMRAVDRGLRATLDPEHPLKDSEKTPKYLQKFIDQEIEAWNSWAAAHAPVHIDIDLSRLAGIRSAAAETREALLIDEERAGNGTLVAAADGTSDVENTSTGRKDAADRECASETEVSLLFGRKQEDSEAVFRPQQQGTSEVVAAQPSNDTEAELTGPQARTATGAVPAPAQPDSPAPSSPQSGPLSPAQTDYLRALLDGDERRAAEAAQTAGASVDLLVDAINEALFDQLGDTALEYGPDGNPRLIEDYRDDVEGILNHE